MLHKTGPGKISIDNRFPGQGMIKALLYNFDVDGDTIKPEHYAFLQHQVVPLLQNDHGHIWMQGSASKSGTNVHNMELSRRRVNHIAQVLSGFGILDRQMQLDAVGEQDAQAHANEDEKDRAVEIIVLPVLKQSPPPPKKIPAPPPVSTQFKVRLLGSLAVGAGGHGESTFFQIADTTNRLTSFYIYVGGGASGGLIPGQWLSATLKGDWNPFTTNLPIRVSQFEGAARFTTGGAGNDTKNYLNMMGLPQGVSTVPRVLSIKTGFTIGIGASTSVGNMFLKPREEMIYNGD